MMERLRFWNQYGYQPDVFKKYRDAVARSNRGSLKVMCIVAVVSSLLVYIYGVTSNQPRGGGTYCQILLIVGLAGGAIIGAGIVSLVSLIRRHKKRNAA